MFFNSHSIPNLQDHCGVATGERTGSIPVSDYSHLEGSCHESTEGDGNSNASPDVFLHNDSEVDTIENDSPRCLDSGSESSSSCLSLEMESEFETEQDADHDKVFSDSVYDGCPLPCQISTILVMSLINRHKLTQRAAQDVIKVLIAHFPDGHRSFTSLYMYTLKTRFAALVGRQPEGEQIKFVPTVT